MSKNKNKDTIFNIIIIALYTGAMAAVSYFHEPWFDEIQAYLIARDASIFEILFKIPHYEGHPFLWHLYLVPFAKSGIPFELGLKSASIILNTAAMTLFVFKSPFKKIIRYTIPFTYYFFYLFGVVSRCYSITMLGFVLMAITYKNRNTKPILYVLSMMLTCLSSAYGIVFCGGLAIVWVIDIIKEMGLKNAVKNIFKDKRIVSLIGLLIFALAIIYSILPNEDTLGTHYPAKEPLVSRLFYMFILAPTESVFMHHARGNYHINHLELNLPTILAGLAAFSVFALLVYIVCKSKHKLKELIIPYTIFAVFSAVMYFTEHHISNITYFFLFVMWISFEDSSPIILPKWMTKDLDESKIEKNKKTLLILFASISIAIPLYWTSYVTVSDINYNYDSCKDIAAFIKEHELQDAQIMSEYMPLYNDEEIISGCINIQSHAVLNAYFGKNIIYSLNNKEEGYIKHFIPSDEYYDATLDTWRSLGAPDVLIGQVDLDGIFMGAVTTDDYSPVFTSMDQRFVKDDFATNSIPTIIYVRNDLLDDYNLVPIDVYAWWMNECNRDKE